jgi:hypothetical protein
MVAVRYHCPRCGVVVAVERDARLADRSVTPYPLEGWTYAAPDEPFEAEDGVRFVCGESAGAEWHEDGCGEPFYLSFVRFDGGERVDPDGSERVELGVGPQSPEPRSP